MGRLSSILAVVALTFTVLTTTTQASHANDAQVNSQHTHAKQAAKKTKKHKNKHKKNRRLKAPTQITFISAECVETEPGETWKVTATWKVTGGRYTNLGNPPSDQMPRYGDNVWRGGARYLTSSQNFHGFPSDPTTGVTTDFTFQHLIAPIGKRSITKQRNITKRLPVTFTCPSGP